LLKLLETKEREDGRRIIRRPKKSKFGDWNVGKMWEEDKGTKIFGTS
jgi:hypothetical protein